MICLACGKAQLTERPHFHWDGLYRCEDHPAGTHFTIEEAEFCINGTPPSAAPDPLVTYTDPAGGPDWEPRRDEA